MADQIRPVADSPMDAEPDTVGTPEGDNEYRPDQPLTPAPDGEQTPRGSDPDDCYKSDDNGKAEWRSPKGS